MRKRWRVILLALGLPVVLIMGAMLPSSPALAVTYGPPSACWAGEGGCFIQNLDGGLFIYGIIHNEPIFSELGNGIGFSYVQKDGVWGWMKSNYDGLCWNESSGRVYLDSCVAPDANEYFDFVSCPNAPNYWCIHNYAEGNTLNLAGDSDGGDLYFTSGDNHTSEWDMY